MKIAVVDTTIDGELIGGGHLFLPGLLAGLVARGHEVHLITKGTTNPKIERMLAESGASVRSGFWDARALVDDSVRGFAEWVNRLAPDIYLINTSADIGWVALPHLDGSIATLAIGHTDSETFYMPVRHYGKFLTRVVGVSDKVCESYVSSCDIDEADVSWIPYGVEAAADISRFDDEDPVRLIYVGRIVEEQKRISDLVRILRRLHDRGVPFSIDIVGDGEGMPYLKDSLADMISSNEVKVQGWLEAGAVIERMRGSEIFLLTSDYEGFCIALTEAMANGCCPVVTDIRSGNGQLVSDGENGFLVPVGDVEAFVERIAALASNRTQLRGLRRIAFETGRQFSVDRMVGGYERAFEAAATEVSRSPRRKAPDFEIMPSCRSRYPLWLRRIKARLKAALV